MQPRLAAVYGWLLLLPALVMLAAFTHYPAVVTVWHSFFSTARGKREAKFVGLDNYAFLLDDDIFWQVLWNNFWYALGTIPVSVALAIVMALWVNGKLAGRGFLRMSYFTPTVLPLIAVANIWMFFYTPGFGLIDQITGFFGFPSHNWLGDPDTVLNAIIVVAIWKEAGFFMIFYLAALQSIPPALAEAAVLEGAGRWYFFRRVTFPLLMPTTLFVLINAGINSFRLVDHIFLMTEGGPDNASSLLLFYIFENAFKFWDTAYGATLTVVLLAILAAVSIGQFLYLERKVHYQ
ncbi:MAG: sugar ABC transporter permease [Rhodospirillales bacterium]|nr:sugar ABC transporter permease [Rhodospirillales bacterium]